MSAASKRVAPEHYWFSVVEVEVNSRCNKRCSYCPVAVLPVPKVPRYMDDRVFERLIDELVDIDFSGKFSYHFYNEPLLRKDLERLVARVFERLPKVYQLLYTNGDFLGDERYETLKTAGIDHFLVTRHDGDPIPERPRQTVQYPQDLLLTNRGGIMTNVMVLPEPLQKPCFAPFDFLTVTVTGDVVLCCDDSERHYVMGNILDGRLRDIWFSAEFMRIRRELAAGNRRDATALCARCSSTEFFAAGEYYQKDLAK
jgi:cyclic pyranopterin phosphate synthase